MIEHVVVPSKGWSAALLVTGSDPVFAVLGPFRPFTWVVRLDFAVQSAGSARWEVTAGWQGTSDTSRSTIGRGRPVLDRSDHVASGFLTGERPLSVEWDLIAGELFRWSLPVGVRVQSGLEFIGISVDNSDPVSVGDALVTAEVVELFRVPAREVAEAVEGQGT